MTDYSCGLITGCAAVEKEENRLVTNRKTFQRDPDAQVGLLLSLFQINPSQLFHFFETIKKCVVSFEAQPSC